MPGEPKDLRRIPAVDRILQRIDHSMIPPPVLVALVREELAAVRKSEMIPGSEEIVERVRQQVAALERLRIQPVINATGVVIHTNLGRSPLGSDVMQHVGQTGASYNNLEFDLNTGRRGSRGDYVEHCLATLCRAEAATVVNNCAAALVLILRHFTKERPQVVISRGELVQNGGGFRIPDILETSGATLKEVGTTNRTTIGDYTRALGRQTGLILKVHRSNFFMDGFVEAPSTKELGALTKRKRVPFVEDLGSGALFQTESIEGLEHEPTPSEVLKAGVDLVCFSGDKLMGGPQAGIIAGRRKHVQALKKDPFFRALRCDKLILSALQLTAEVALNASTGNAGPERPTVAQQLLAADPLSLKKRANRIARTLASTAVEVSVIPSRAQVGGGTLPRSEVPSFALSLKPTSGSTQALNESLRRGEPPIVGSIANGRVQLDLRTVFPEQDKQVIDSLRSVLATA
jgi:L-seryl-tRNA(Ser) seleniumtransferase